jgi:lysophospholipase L1-like esterase
MRGSKFVTQFGASFTPEAKAYAALAGLDTATLRAVDRFVRTGKKDGWWDLLLEVYPFAGPTLASSLVKLKTRAGGATSLVNTNFLAANYSQASGIGTGASQNTNKSLATGVILSDYSLSHTDLCIGLSGLDVGLSDTDAGFLLGDTPVSGDCLLQAASGSIVARSSVTFSPPGVSVRLASYATNVFRGAENGVMCVESTATGTALSSTTEVVLFKRAVGGGSSFFARGKVGLTLIGHAMLTRAQQISLSKAMYDFEAAIRTTYFVSPVYAFLGDSNTAKGLATTPATNYTSLVCAARSARHLNFGINNSKMSTNAGASGAWVEGGLQKYAEIRALNPSKILMMLGTNDFNVDVGVTGTPATYAAYQADMTTVLTAFASWIGASNVIGVVPPFNPAANATKLSNYTNAALAAIAAVPGILSINLSQAIIDTGSTGTYYGDTTPHLNNTGHTFFRDLILALI